MPLKLKTALVQIRVDPDLLERFRLATESQNATVSETVRAYMHHMVRAFEQEQSAKDSNISPVPPSGGATTK